MLTELADRRDRALRRCEADGVSCVVVASPTMLLWLAGVGGWGCYVPQFLVMWRGGGGADGGADRVHAEIVMRAMDVGAVPEGAVDAVHCYPDDAVDHPERHPVESLVSVLTRASGGAGGAGPVGIEADGAYFRARYLMELERLGVAVQDCTPALSWARLVKSEAELDRIRAAGRIADAAMAAAVKAAGAGARRCDVAAAAQAEQTRGGGRPAIPAIVVQARHGAHQNWSPEPLAPDDTVRVELAGVVDGYHAPVSRTILMPGCPLETVRRAERQHRVLVAALAAGVRALRPGVRAREVHARMAAVLDANLMSKGSRLGYSFGLGHTPDWGESTLSIRAGDDTVVPAGCCVHLILGCGDGWLVQASEACIVTADGVELVCRTPRQLMYGGHLPSFRPSDAWMVPALTRHLGRAAPPGLDHAGPALLGRAAADRADRAIDAIASQARWVWLAHNQWWPGLPGGQPYRATPLHAFDDLGRALGVQQLSLKDESARMGSRSFKMLGCTAAVHSLIRQGRFDPLTQSLCTMSDGNHGAALAAVGAALRCPVEVWLPRDVGPAARQRLRLLGAQLHEVDGSYDEAVAAAADACHNDDARVLVSDQAFGDYVDVPRVIAAGYLQLFHELEDQSVEPPTHVFVQCGVGGLASAAATWLSTTSISPPPRLVIVEAEGSACYLQSARAGRSTEVAECLPTTMEGLNCGTPSAVAWDAVAARAAGYVSVADEWADLALRMLKDGPIATAATGVSGLAGLAAASASASVQRALGLDEHSRVVCLVTEGD